MIIPVLNEIDMIEATLSRLQPSRACGHEVIVVDGGSTDDTDRVAMPLADKVIKIEAGRARQMNAGARASEGVTFYGSCMPILWCKQVPIKY